MYSAFLSALVGDTGAEEVFSTCGARAKEGGLCCPCRPCWHGDALAVSEEQPQPPSQPALTLGAALHAAWLVEAAVPAATRAGFTALATAGARRCMAAGSKSAGEGGGWGWAGSQDETEISPLDGSRGSRKRQPLEPHPLQINTLLLVPDPCRLDQAASECMGSLNKQAVRRCRQAALPASTAPPRPPPPPRVLRAMLAFHLSGHLQGAQDKNPSWGCRVINAPLPPAPIVAAPPPAASLCRLLPVRQMQGEGSVAQLDQSACSTCSSVTRCQPWPCVPSPRPNRPAYLSYWQSQQRTWASGQNHPCQPSRPAT